MYRLENVLRPYPWGSTTAIAALQGRAPSGGPEAELWIGAHPGSPSLAVRSDGSRDPLDALISADPEGTLGPGARELFGDRLPFLAKILAAGSPLSLQVHPTMEQARAGFAAENAAGVASDAPQRNYRDDNHKPEMILALTPFEALCGFRPAAESRRIFTLLRDSFGASGSPVPALLDGVIADLAAAEAEKGPLEAKSAVVETEEAALRAAFSRLITGGEDAAAAVRAVVGLLESGAAPAGYAAELGTAAALAADYPGDPGVLISLLLNRASLLPGEALYLPAGNVHAYLSGLGVEVMASSDNVLRGGLTGKHVDVPELLATVDFRPLPLPLLEAARTELGQEIWAPPFREFQLQRVRLAPGGSPVPLAQNGPLVLIAVAGSATLDTPRDDAALHRGDSVFVPAAESPAMLHPANGATDDAVVFAVTVSGA
ncbi:MAG: mannose-6-phosphate isomerase, class I [Actinomycetales bacterium]